jgi:putative transcriptional regulator
MRTPADVRDLRLRLRLDPAAFARIVGVDPRTVTRWEQGAARPTGASEAVLSAFEEKLRKDPDQAAELAELVGAAARVGGLAYLILKLLDERPSR